MPALRGGAEGGILKKWEAPGSDPAATQDQDQLKKQALKKQTSKNWGETENRQTYAQLRRCCGEEEVSHASASQGRGRGPLPCPWPWPP